MTDYRLFYFPIKGRAERIRLMFAYAGINFDDIRWDEKNDWVKHKDGKFVLKVFQN